jgi:hypothetical protein
MLNNYKKLDNGVIQQIEIQKIKYDNDYIQTYNNFGEKGRNMAYFRLGLLLGSLKFIPNSILDIGYGNGDFLNACKNIISKCYGNDISNYKIPEGCEFVENIFNEEYDVITFFDSLEHFDDINFLDKLKCKYIYITLPWCHYFDDKWFENWKHRKPNEHLWHFNDKSLVNFFEEQGYENIVLGNFEDVIRKNNEEYPNILCGLFRKKQI